MKRFLFLIALFCAFLAHSQSTEEVVKNAIIDFFDGFHKGDSLKLTSVLMKDTKLQSAVKTKEGQDKLMSTPIDKFIASLIKPRKDIYEERLLSYKVLVDGNMAHVWTPYEFYVNSQLSHCGVNSFQLFNDNGQWKITYILDTRRRTGCETKSE
ncbi:nuclear transport factor 2 family protein [Spongiivirga citrea]|uniref:Nuclear transport factor 2 family protein n=1 Tax=Spongiivirga citrea TaxID=1481457 RepID=A0A6M0CI90_9FLAO|nr:nuclear transport factor 2 family protein [Spongiivirga citrea]NER15649.1 nuclear transport factor 2 family protein [Spongiivirga citrea]